MRATNQQDQSKFTLPANLTLEMIIDGVERSTFGLENVGFCLACGEESSGCEPDAARYLCEGCGKRMVYGAEELLMRFGGAF
jgi:hypothetical protein